MSPTSIPPSQGSYLMPAFETATVGDAMRPGVISCPPNTTLATVARTMATHHIHSVVVDRFDDASGKHQFALISDLDVVRSANTDIEATTAADVAATEIPTVAPAESLQHAAQIMLEHRVTHLLVLEGERPLGVLSSLDIAGILAWGRA